MPLPSLLPFALAALAVGSAEGGAALDLAAIRRARRAHAFASAVARVGGVR